MSDREVMAAAVHLEMSVDEFIDQWCELAPDRRGLILQSQPDHSCVMLDDAGLCRIHPVKPQQCRDFPNVWNFPGWRELCDAKEVGVEWFPNQIKA